jgi:single-strand DNA-binding protein
MYASTTILGRVVRTELKTIPSGKQVLNFSVAVNKKFKDKESTTFFDCVAWDKQAEVISKYFEKGSMIFLSTEPESANYEKDGKTIYRTNYKVNQFAFTGEKRDGSVSSQTQTQSIGVDAESLPF